MASIRLRKLQRKSIMRKMRITVSGLIIFSCIVTAILYYWNRFSYKNAYKHSEKVLFTTKRTMDRITTKHYQAHIRSTDKSIIKFVEVYKTGEEKNNVNDSVSLFRSEKRHLAKFIHTIGCKIPKAIVDYSKYIKNHTKKRVKCGERGVILVKLGQRSVRATIKSKILIKNMKHKDSNFNCCYQFLLKTISSPSPMSHNRKLIYSNCTTFNNESEIFLQSDFINIKCFEHTKTNVTSTIYDDQYAFVKKNEETLPSYSLKYNVLMIGMDSMSLPRAGQTLPRTVTFFRTDDWVALQGYHKVADNTFPNLMAAFTGHKLKTVEKKCYDKMDSCNRFMIWSKFKEAGYVTAYGEDYLQLPDTFTTNYKFHKPPTDHYMRPFFLKGERKHENNTFLCAGKVCSGKQILDYALDFATTYKNNSFFGIFWINSFSHDAKSRPHEADKLLEKFFYQLVQTEIIENTFVIFFSDHGIRFGGQRYKMEAYYDDRMPMFFMKIPLDFKRKHPFKVAAILVNQYRLVTPYDIYSTLLDIRWISVHSNRSSTGPPEGCPKCHSIFYIVNSNRTCKDAAVSDKWCGCHKMYPITVPTSEAQKSVDIVVNYIRTMVETIKTQRCWSCMTLSLKTVYRVHFYYSKDHHHLFYVVAFSMTPGNLTYEATVHFKNEESSGKIVGPVSFISTYRNLGKCVINRRDRLFCVCQKKQNC